MSLVGRRILVTGASSGIGAGIVEGCAAEGARVVAVARRAERLEALRDATGCEAVVADLTEVPAAQRAVRAAIERLGGLDTVVNAAGVSLMGGVADGLPADWKAMFDLNVLAALVVAQAAIPELRRSPAADIVNIGSMSATRIARPAAGVYAASKAAIRAATQGLRAELVADGIRVTLINPGPVRTEVASHTREDALREVLQAQLDRIGLDPADVARVVVQVLDAPRDVNLSEINLQPREQV